MLTEGGAFKKLVSRSRPSGGSPPAHRIEALPPSSGGTGRREGAPAPSQAVARPILPTAWVPSPLPTVFCQLEAAENILLMVTEKMNESYGKRTLSNLHLSKPYLEELRNDRYGPKAQSEEGLVEVKKMWHKSLYTAYLYARSTLELWVVHNYSVGIFPYCPYESQHI
jgi:hypothetical protein